jgi:hypothetical protein
MTQDIPHMLVHTFLQVANQLTGVVGLTPLQVLIFLGGLFVVMLLVQIVGAIRGRTKFSLEDTGE